MSVEKYLPNDLIFGSLQEDIENKPRNRCSELQLAAKIKGLLSDKLDITTKNLTISFDSAFNKATESNLSDLKAKPNTKQP